MRKKIARGIRIGWTVGALLVVESFVFGLAVLPAIGFWQWVAALPPFGPEFLRAVILAASIAPAYLIFSCSLMALTAVACRLLRWRTPEGNHSIRALSPPVLRWVKYSAVTHVVRVFAGELFRATPIWRWYLRAMGAKVGRGVHVNTAAVYDLNLITLDDHVVVGGRAQISAHLVEGDTLKTAPVVIGKGATIGAASFISPGAVVGEGARVGALSFVGKRTQIPPFTAYAGVPARFVQRYREPLEPLPVGDEELLYREPGPEE